MHGIRREIVMLPLFAVRNDGRAGGFEPLDGVSNGNFVERSEVGILAVGFGDSLDEIGGAFGTSNPPRGGATPPRAAAPPLPPPPPPPSPSSPHPPPPPP